MKRNNDALYLKCIFLSKADFDNSQCEKLEFHFHKQNYLMETELN